MPLNWQPTGNGVELTPAARELQLFDPQTGVRLLNYRELEQARQAAEHTANDERQRAEEERQRAEQAEQQIAALLERPIAQGIDPE